MERRKIIYPKTSTRQPNRREVDKKKLLDQRTELKDMHKILRWLPEGLTASMLLTMGAGVAFAASGDRYAGPAIVAEGALMGIFSMGSYVAREVLVESLDKVQEILQIRHNIYPDKGFLDRRAARYRRELEVKRPNYNK